MLDNYRSLITCQTIVIIPLIESISSISDIHVHVSEKCAAIFCPVPISVQHVLIWYFAIIFYQYHCVLFQYAHHLTQYIKTVGDRAFSVAGPRDWNRLPGEIRDCQTLGAFKRKLKTHLFRAAYGL